MQIEMPPKQPSWRRPKSTLPCKTLNVTKRIFLKHIPKQESIRYGKAPSERVMDFRKKQSQIYGFLRKIGFYVSKTRILTICTPSDPNSRRRQDPILRFPPFPPKTPFRKIFIAKFYGNFPKKLALFLTKILYPVKRI